MTQGHSDLPVSRLEWGSSPNGPLSIASKSGSVEVRDSSRSIESATGGSTDKAGVTVATIVVHEDVDTDEFELDSDLSAEYLSLRKGQEFRHRDQRPRFTKDKPSINIGHLCRVGTSNFVNRLGLRSIARVAAPTSIDLEQHAGSGAGNDAIELDSGLPDTEERSSALNAPHKRESLVIVPNSP